MKKYISFVLLTAMLTMTTACGSRTSSQTSDAAISMQSLQEEMLSADTTLPDMTTVSSADEQAELNFTSLSDLSYDLVDSYFYA